jgi:8-oxo-dGTP diphosphatase
LSTVVSSESRNHPARPWAGVVVVVWRDDQFLLTLRAKSPHAGFWGLPGGALNLGETAFAAAVREVREETGILCRPRASFTTVDIIERDAVGAVAFHFLLAAVVADYEHGSLMPSDDAQDARWFTLNELAILSNVPLTAELVAQSRAHRD